MEKIKKFCCVLSKSISQCDAIAHDVISSKNLTYKTLHNVMQYLMPPDLGHHDVISGKNLTYKTLHNVMQYLMTPDLGHDVISGRILTSHWLREPRSRS